MFDMLTIRFSDPSHVDLFQQYLNQKHPNIKFTVERENNNTLPFLDVEVTRTNDEFKTGTYRKPTFSGVYSNYRSLIPSAYKIGLVTTLLYRMYELVSDYERLDKEIKDLKSILRKNRYPDGFIDKVIYTFLNNKYTQKLTVPTVPRRKIRMYLPYLGNTSVTIKKKLKRMFRMIPSCSVEIVFQTTYRMGNMFRFKDSLPQTLLTDFIYYFKCRSCAASYVGQSYRHQLVRFCEHAGLSPRTRRPLVPSLVNASAVKIHMMNNHHRVDPDLDFRILSRGGTRAILDIKESIMIRRMKPTLNDNASSATLSLYR